MTAFFRFPHTAHLAWLAQGRPRDDKVLTAAEAADFLSQPLVIEEKVDGANLGLSVDDSGGVRGQNRGTYLDLHALGPQWKPLRAWLQRHGHALADALYPDLILFGEWCHALHSIPYTRLPDWFLGFDVYDRGVGAFWSVDRRDELLASLGLARVPALGHGRFTMRELLPLSARSHLTDGPAEGLYLRREAAGALVARAKLVRPEFTQSIGEHWSRRRLETNSLAPGGVPDVSPTPHPSRHH